MTKKYIFYTTKGCICTIYKPVHVRAYLRYRREKWEKVREHCRRLPKRR